MRDILLQRDTDCGDCLGGDHCLKCLFLDPKRRDTFKPPKAEIWLTGDLRPGGQGADDILYALKWELKEMGLFTAAVDKGFTVVVANLCEAVVVRHNRRDRIVDFGQKISRHSLAETVDSLESAGFLTRTDGKRGKEAGAFSGTDLFYRLVAAYNPQWVKEPRAVILRDRTTKNPIPNSHLSRSQEKLSRWLEEVNRFNHDRPLLLIRSPKDLSVFRTQLSQIFSGSMRLGGRVYAAGGSYQNIPNADRKQLWFCGEAVAEPDFSAHHIRLAYALEGISYRSIHRDDDPYHLEIDGELIDRNVCKLIVLIGINSGSKKETLSAYSQKVLNDEAPERENLSEVYDAFLGKHSPIRHWFGSGRDNGLKLHKLEGEIMIRAMHSLMKDGVPSYPVHDSLIVPESKELVAIEAMEQAYHQTLKSAGRKVLDPPVIDGANPNNQSSQKGRNLNRLPCYLAPKTVEKSTVLGEVITMKKKTHSESALRSKEGEL